MNHRHLFFFCINTLFQDTTQTFKIIQRWADCYDEMKTPVGGDRLLIFMAFAIPRPIDTFDGT